MKGAALGRMPKHLASLRRRAQPLADDGELVDAAGLCKAGLVGDGAYVEGSGGDEREGRPEHHGGRVRRTLAARNHVVRAESRCPRRRRAC